MERRTKIVATLGPASSGEGPLRALLRAGVDVFRLNYSHGTAEGHRATLARLRALAREEGREPAVLQDLCGPKLRTGPMAGGAMVLQEDTEVRITPDLAPGADGRFGTTYPQLAEAAEVNGRLLLDDGRLRLRVVAVEGDEVRCRVERGGVLHSHKGMNLPDFPMHRPALTDKDRADLRDGLAQGVDFVALSFVRRAEDLAAARAVMEDAGRSARLIAKIEKPEAVDHIDAILSEADGIMVARGDLGVEMDLARVPLVQKELIRRTNQADRYVITATQMLESMIREPGPTRAEVSDLANAILDGTDALMLSGETAVGAYPLQAVAVVDEVARETEGYLAAHAPPRDWGAVNPDNPVEDALGHAVHQVCEDLQVRAILAYSATGGTALFLSKGRPCAPIVVFTDSERALRQMRLFWGVRPVLAAQLADRDAFRDHALAFARDQGLAGPGEHVLLVAGRRFGTAGASDSLEVARLEQG